MGKQEPPLIDMDGWSSLARHGTWTASVSVMGRSAALSYTHVNNNPRAYVGLGCGASGSRRTFTRAPSESVGWSPGVPHTRSKFTGGGAFCRSRCVGAQSGYRSRLAYRGRVPYVGTGAGYGVWVAGAACVGRTEVVLCRLRFLFALSAPTLALLIMAFGLFLNVPILLTAGMVPLMLRYSLAGPPHATMTSCMGGSVF